MLIIGETKCGRGVYGDFVLSGGFFCKSKTALKVKSINYKKNPKIHKNMSDFNLPITYSEILFIETNFSFEIITLSKRGCQRLTKISFFGYAKES